MGVFLAFIVGGYFGHAMFLIWGLWYYGTDYLMGYLSTVERADGSIDQLALLLPIVVRWGSTALFGIAAYELYRRTLGKRLMMSTEQRQTTIAEQPPAGDVLKAAPEE